VHHRISRRQSDDGCRSCCWEGNRWSDEVMTAEQAFMWYAFSLGFAIPVAAISVFYLVVTSTITTLTNDLQL